MEGGEDAVDGGGDAEELEGRVELVDARVEEGFGCGGGGDVAGGEEVGDGG